MINVSESLHLLSTCDRYCSGITLLSPTKKTMDKMKIIRTRIRTARHLNSGFLGVVTGHANLDLQVIIRLYSGISKYEEINFQAAFF